MNHDCWENETGTWHRSLWVLCSNTRCSDRSLYTMSSESVLLFLASQIFFVCLFVILFSSLPIQSKSCFVWTLGACLGYFRGSDTNRCIGVKVHGCACFWKPDNNVKGPPPVFPSLSFESALAWRSPSLPSSMLRLLTLLEEGKYLHHRPYFPAALAETIAYLIYVIANFPLSDIHYQSSEC